MVTRPTVQGLLSGVDPPMSATTLHFHGIRYVYCKYLFKRKIPKSYRLLGQVWSGLSQTGLGTVSKWINGGIFEPFLGDSGKHENTLFLIGSDCITFLDFAEWNGDREIFVFCEHIFTGHIFSAYLITNVYFMLFTGFAEKLLMAFCSFEKIQTF